MPPFDLESAVYESSLGGNPSIPKRVKAVDPRPLSEVKCEGCNEPMFIEADTVVTRKVDGEWKTVTVTPLRCGRNRNKKVAAKYGVETPIEPHKCQKLVYINESETESMGHIITIEETITRFLQRHGRSRQTDMLTSVANKGGSSALATALAEMKRKGLVVDSFVVHANKKVFSWELLPEKKKKGAISRVESGSDGQVTTPEPEPQGLTSCWKPEPEPEPEDEYDERTESLGLGLSSAYASETPQEQQLAEFATEAHRQMVHDQAIIFGSGESSQPSGILNQPEDPPLIKLLKSPDIAALAALTQHEQDWVLQYYRLEKHRKDTTA